MTRLLRLRIVWVLAAAVLAIPAGRALSQGGAGARARQSWALEEALAELRLHPRDAYLQYVVLQLARRANRFSEVAGQVDALVPEDRPASARERGERVDLFSIFNGALAVQESLQLDTMRVATTGSRAPTLADAEREVRRASNTNRGGAQPNINGSMNSNRRPPARRRGSRQRRGRNTRSQRTAPPAPPVPISRSVGVAIGDDNDTPQPFRNRPDEVVPVSSLEGPTVKSHPWEKMLAGRKPEVSPLARSVPEDFYLVEFRTLNRLLDALDASDLWGTHLFNQAFREAKTLSVGDRLKRQLAIETDPLTRPFYDLVVEGVAAAGSDLFVREGSDVTLLFRVKQPLVFKLRMDSFLANAESAHPRAKRTTGTYLGVEYVQLATPERDLSVIAADPAPGLHVRSNSLAAFRRVVESVVGKDERGRAVRRLGDTQEYAFIRTLMPQGDEANEDGLFYMSDPFIRRLVGPELKLTERRRLLCYNHLRMTGHAALLFRTEQGRWPDSLGELARTNTSPGTFGEGALSCPDGGRYSLSEDKTTGVCSHHGHALRLTPNIEIPVARVSGEEANLYRAFVEEYNRYWRVYFDPIAIRLKVTPEQYRAETIILPLIDNSVYTGLASALGGEPEPLDGLPVPRRNIFSAMLRFNKAAILAGIEDLEKGFRGVAGPPSAQRSDAEWAAQYKELLEKGVGNQIGIHAYDSHPNFDLNMASLLGLMVGSGVGRGGGRFFDDELFLAVALSSLNSPVYVSVPVRDAGVVDRHLERLDADLASVARQTQRGRGFDFEQDFFKYQLSAGQTARGFGLRLGPAKLRFFWARIGEGFYVASKPFILEDLAAMHAATGTTASPSAAAARVETDADSTGHALARVRAYNWAEVLPDYRLSWAENEREACLNNLGPLSDVARALTARAPAQASTGDAPTGDALDKAVVELADRLHAVHYFCPEGGSYTVAPGGKSVSCTVHGTASHPRQPSAPTERSAAGRTMREIQDMSATLTFTEDGLRAVVVVRRKGQ